MTNPASQTAFGPMSAVAAEQYYPEKQRLVHDEMALQFLPANLRPLAKLTRWSPARTLLFNLSEKRAPGVWAGILCRKRYIDEKLVEALNLGIDAVVNLGAGLDTRAYRFPALSAIPVYEVDLPANIDYKRTRLQQLFGRVPAHVTLVAIDFNIQELVSVLCTHGYQARYKTFFIWEAVTQYLSDQGVQKTFNSLAQVNTGSRLAFTYVRKDFIDGTARYGSDTLYRVYRVKRQLWHFGLEPRQVPDFLSSYGWKELEQVGSQEYISRYLKPSGRIMPVTEIERSVYAEKI